MRDDLRGKDRICLPLDGIADRKELAKIVRKLSPVVGIFKIGLELIVKLGPEAVAIVKENGGNVFFDGKFCDIPNTVGNASQAAASMKVDFFNVHASCGIPAMQAAVANKGAGKVLAVTVLTSLDDTECEAIFGASSQDKVTRFALMANEAGVDGLICSPREVSLLRSRPELSELLLVTPGVRPEWAATGDQKRVMTPGEAIKAGADYLVIGRPITKPPENKFASSVEAAMAIAKEIERAEEEKINKRR